LWSVIFGAGPTTHVQQFSLGQGIKTRAGGEKGDGSAWLFVHYCSESQRVIDWDRKPSTITGAGPVLHMYDVYRPQHSETRIVQTDPSVSISSIYIATFLLGLFLAPLVRPIAVSLQTGVCKIL
jgi:hypothetical protein